MELFQILFFMVFWVTTQGLFTLNLNSQNWKVHNGNKSIQIPANVPGGIYSDLRSANILKTDILYRFNDVAYRWVGHDNWTYSTLFHMDAKYLNSENIYLVLHGVDTMGNIILNKVKIGSVGNMFVRNRYNIKRHLQVGQNELVVEILSPISEAQKIAANISYMIPLECWPPTYNGECHINKIRKMQSSFGWDWGPAFPSVGIWQPATLEMTNDIIIRSVGTVLLDKGSNWQIIIRAWFDPEELQFKKVSPGFLAASLFLNATTSIRNKISVTPSKLHGHLEARIALIVPKDKVELWWPNGYGNQKLYDLTVAFKTDRETSRKHIKIGFRTISLIQTAVSNDTHKGLTFFFKVNDVPIFAKGSNWIPSHVLPESSANPERVKNLLSDARNANFNMLRVWGGGLYESDMFYQICDELGIMIWQDLMFACNMYPTHPEFLSSVKIEIQQQLNRLQHHPSIALWAGNNENEAALSGNWYGTATDFGRYKEDYIKLYVETIKPIVTFVDPSRPYLTSSPSNGLDTEREGYVAKNPQDSLYGDVHYYNYLADGWDWLIYPKTRFASEYGVQSLPSLATLSEVALPSDLELDSDFFTSRQHLPVGFPFMKQQITKNLPTSNDTETFIYLSQINQAMSMKVETESYRRERSMLHGSGEGLTMGALYWQLNDVWQAPSWSSIDFAGRWKMLHYYARDFFAPTITSAVVTADDKLSIAVVSDHQSIDSAILYLNVYRAGSDFNATATFHFNVSIPGGESAEVFRKDILHFLSTCKQFECFFTIHLEDLNENKLAPDNFIFLVPLHFKTLNSNVVIKSIIQKSKYEAVVTLETDSIALFVWLETPEIQGIFSDNGFHMVQPIKEVKFISKKFLDLPLFKSSLTVRSLRTRYK